MDILSQLPSQLSSALAMLYRHHHLLRLPLLPSSISQVGRSETSKWMQDQHWFRPENAFLLTLKYVYQ